MSETIKKKRNSIMELFRLLAAIWVLVYHCFPDSLHGYFGVEFFFMLSGLFFLKTYKKENEKPLFKGLLHYTYARIKPILITLLICLPFSIYHYIANFSGVFSDSVFGYLWFIPHLLVVLAVFFILRRLLKKDLIFFITTAVISLACFMLVLLNITRFGMVRGVAMVGFGIMISLIPNLKKSKLSSAFSLFVCFVALTVTVFYEVFQINTDIFQAVFLVLLLPSIIYFAKQIDYSNSTLNKVCSINFGIYAYQEVARFVLSFVCVSAAISPVVFCSVAIVLAIIEKIIITLIKRSKIKHQQ